MNNSALKRDRQSKVRRERNRVLKSKIHTAFLKLNSSILSKNKEEIEDRYRKYASEVDKAVNKGIFHVNKGARKKSRISKLISKILTA